MHVKHTHQLDTKRMDTFSYHLAAAKRVEELSRELWNIQDGRFSCTRYDTEPFNADDETMILKLKARNERMNALLNNGQEGTGKTPSLTSKTTLMARSEQRALRNGLREDTLAKYWEEGFCMFNINEWIEEKFSRRRRIVVRHSLGEVLQIVKRTLASNSDWARYDTTRMVNEYMTSINVSRTEALLYSDPEHFNVPTLLGSSLNRAYVFWYLGLGRIMRRCMQLYDGERWARISHLLPLHWFDESAKVPVGFFESRFTLTHTLQFVRCLSWILAGYKPIRAEHAIQKILIPMFSGLFTKLEESVTKGAVSGRRTRI